MVRNTKILIWLQLLTITTIIFVTSGYILRLKQRRGVVNGILYIPEDSSAIIDGQILKEGNIIHNTEIVRIYKTQVEFQKGYKRWKQRVRERPNPAWKEPN